MKYLNFTLLILIFFLIGCKGDTSSSPVQVDDTPQLLSDEFHLLTADGDTIPTGVPIPLTGDSIKLPEPEVFRVDFSEPYIPEHPKKYKATSPIELVLDAHQEIMTYQPDTLLFNENDSIIYEELDTRWSNDFESGELIRKTNAIIDCQILGRQNGLENENITSFFKDSRDLLWFSAGDHLYVFDGVRLKSLELKNARNKRLSIWETIEDKEGMLWFASINFGVLKFDGIRWWNYNIIQSEEHLQTEGLRVSSIIEDKDERKWVAARNKGLFIITETGLVKVFDQAFKLLRLRNNDILFSTPADLWKYDGTQFKKILSANDFDFDVIWDLKEDLEGGIWLLTNKGFGSINNNALTYQNFPEGLGTAYAPSFDIDQEGNIWIGTTGGLLKYKNQEYLLFDEETGLNISEVRGVQFDRKDNRLYVSNINGGLNIINLNSYRYYREIPGLKKFDLPEAGPSPRNRPLGITPLSNITLYDGMYIAGNRFGFAYQSAIGSYLHTDNRNFYKLKGNSIARYRLDQLFKDPETSRFIPGKFVDGFGNIFLYGDFRNNGKLAIINDRTIFLPDLTDFYLSLQTKDGDVWGVNKGGAVKFDGKHITFYTEKEGLSNSPSFPMFEDSEANLWFAVDSVGLYYFDGGNFHEFPYNNELIENNEGEYFYSTVEDKSGNLWLGGKGINVCSKDRYHYFSEEIGIKPDGLVHDLAIDSKGRIWLRTDIELIILEPDTLGLYSRSHIEINNISYRYWRYGYSEGIKLDTYGFRQFFTPEGKSIDSLWFSAQNHLALIKSSDFELPLTQPTVRISQIKLNDKRVNEYLQSDHQEIIYDSLIPFVDYPGYFKSPYQLNNVSFSFYSPQWVTSESISYSYFLEGLQESWSQERPQAKVDFFGLSPGAYNFKVAAIHGGIRGRITEYRFAILPPWWQSWWAKLLYVLAGLAAIYAYLRWRTHTLRNRQKELEQTVAERTAEVVAEKERSDELLLNILPSETAKELKQYGAAQAKDYDLVTVLFTDFKGFTTHSERLEAKELVAEIDYCFIAFDQIMERFGVEKIKTVGDAYLAAAGLPVSNLTNPVDATRAALAIRDFMIQYQKERKEEGREAFEVRIGIHSGPVVAGIVGIKKFAYDIWGDTVNLASRMESSGEVGKVNISQSTYELLKDHPELIFQSRGKIKAKNKGELEMYFVENAS